MAESAQQTEILDKLTCTKLCVSICAKIRTYVNECCVEPQELEHLYAMASGLSDRQPHLTDLADIGVMITTLNTLRPLQAPERQYLNNVLSAAVHLANGLDLAKSIATLYKRRPSLGTIEILIVLGEENDEDEQTLLEAWDYDVTIRDATDTNGNPYIEETEMELLGAPQNHLYYPFMLDVHRISRSLVKSKNDDHAIVTMSRDILNSLWQQSGHTENYLLRIYESINKDRHDQLVEQLATGVDSLPDVSHSHPRHQT